MASISKVVTRVITNTLEVLSSSKTDEASIFWGLSPILICPYTVGAASTVKKIKKIIAFILSVL